MESSSESSSITSSERIGRDLAERVAFFAVFFFGFAVFCFFAFVGFLAFVAIVRFFALGLAESHSLPSDAIVFRAFDFLAAFVDVAFVPPDVFSSRFGK